MSSRSTQQAQYRDSEFVCGEPATQKDCKSASHSSQQAQGLLCSLQPASQSVRYYVKHSRLLGRMDGKARRRGRQKDLGEMFSKHCQNVQRLWNQNRSAAIQKLPFLLGGVTKCEIIAAQFITEWEQAVGTVWWFTMLHDIMALKYHYLVLVFFHLFNTIK